MNLEAFPSAQSGAPDPMFFSRSAGNLGLEASLKLIFFGEREGRWRKGRRKGTGENERERQRQRQTERDLYELIKHELKKTLMDPEIPGLNEMG